MFYENRFNFKKKDVLEKFEGKPKKNLNLIFLRGKNTEYFEDVLKRNANCFQVRIAHFETNHNKVTINVLIVLPQILLLHLDGLCLHEMKEHRRPEQTFTSLE